MQYETETCSKDTKSGRLSSEVEPRCHKSVARQKDGTAGHDLDRCLLHFMDERSIDNERSDPPNFTYVTIKPGKRLETMAANQVNVEGTMSWNLQSRVSIQ